MSDIQQNARNKYGNHVFAAACERYTELLRKQKAEGLTEEETTQKVFFQDEFGFSPPGAFGGATRSYTDYSHGYGGY